MSHWILPIRHSYFSCQPGWSKHTVAILHTQRSLALVFSTLLQSEHWRTWEGEAIPRGSGRGPGAGGGEAAGATEEGGGERTAGAKGSAGKGWLLLPLPDEVTITRWLAGCTHHMLLWNMIQYTNESELNWMNEMKWIKMYLHSYKETLTQSKIFPAYFGGRCRLRWG